MKLFLKFRILLSKINTKPILLFLALLMIFEATLLVDLEIYLGLPPLGLVLIPLTCSAFFTLLLIPQRKRQYKLYRFVRMKYFSNTSSFKK